ncbi:helix-turn-helix transcriptional regulator [Rubellicoccus peritrichatus]|uniref:Helix-turn-helix transcriptional regulator n=1 Tax=Rubellicoccus peritrichatus TaxID=3080537 RepID=A0AAQ3QPY3_9BACT|nr:helix-turn-helix transcriptional regulator [Puniceicoccus sp. CR14]WOO39608.1 helix-turn-helix transcriptional regulator [Puniceicoccus sp. CR14]
MSGFAPFTDKPKTFLMPDHWSLLFFKYPGQLHLDETAFQLSNGIIGLIPPGVKRYFQYYGKSHHLFTHFLYPKGLNDLPKRYPLFRAAGDQATAMEEPFLSMIRCQARNPLLASVTLWQLLLKFDELKAVDSQSESPEVIHPSLKRAMEWIELNLTNSISISEIVSISGSSERSLRRMFRTHASSTIVGYIRQRRMEHAIHLLQGTNLPVKEIACEVGIPDLHLFNKTVKRYWGKAPRLLRKP